MLNEEKKQFQEEQNKLLKTILDLRFFAPWRDTIIDETSLKHDASLEIYLTNQCNQKCEYCYLTKYPELYPADKLDHKLILHNLKLLYDWILEEGFVINRAEFFTGEIWQSQFGLDVLQLTLEYLEDGLPIREWMIPSNCSFIFDDKQMHRIQNYIKAFSQNGASLLFSISVDGAIVENQARPLINGKIRDDEYWEKLFVWAKYNKYYFHPMVAASDIDKWIENYEWWKAQFKKYNMNILDLMMLEVRNDNWTEKNIQDYIKFLNYLIDDCFNNHCEGDKKKFADAILEIRDPDNHILVGYIPYCLPHTDTFIGCTQANHLTIRVGDLAICSCHRLAYDKYLYGHLVVKDDKIVDIEANNPQLAVAVLMGNFNMTSFGCDTCLYNERCLKGCRGAQYEALGDPLFPIPGICHFFDEKYSAIMRKLEEYGVIEYAKTLTSYEKDYEVVQDFLKFYNKWKKTHKKEH